MRRFMRRAPRQPCDRGVLKGTSFERVCVSPGIALINGVLTPFSFSLLLLSDRLFYDRRRKQSKHIRTNEGERSGKKTVEGEGVNLLPSRNVASLPRWGETRSPTDDGSVWWWSNRAKQKHKRLFVIFRSFHCWLCFCAHAYAF